jgi:hypothetical protein
VFKTIDSGNQDIITSKSKKSVFTTTESVQDSKPRVQFIKIEDKKKPGTAQPKSLFRNVVLSRNKTVGTIRKQNKKEGSSKGSMLSTQMWSSNNKQHNFNKRCTFDVNKIVKFSTSMKRTSNLR